MDKSQDANDPHDHERQSGDKFRTHDYVFLISLVRKIESEAVKSPALLDLADWQFDFRPSFQTGDKIVR